MKVAIVGATGAVGIKFIECLQKRNFPVSELRLFASARSLGKVLHFKGTPLRVEKLEAQALKGHDIALFSAGSDLSKKVAPIAAKNGTVVVDNSSAWRMDKNVPLVVPEVNRDDISRHKGIIANPNCSTIALVMALKPLHDKFTIKRVVVSTYQAVSGAGGKALTELDDEVRSMIYDDKIFKRQIFPRQIAFNLIPQIPQKNAFAEDGYTTEEIKMMKETNKIMGDDSIRVSATCVRVSVRNTHSESVNVETKNKVTVAEAVQALKDFPGVIVKQRNEDFPTPAEVSGKDEVHVGRIRLDPTIENGLNFWLCSDNLLKGAALNAVQIAECLMKPASTSAK